MSIHIGILGGDGRQVHLAKALAEEGYSIISYRISDVLQHPSCCQAQNLLQFLEKCSIILGPIPFTKDQVFIHSSGSQAADLRIDNFTKYLKEHQILIAGNLPVSLKNSCDQQKIAYYDVMKNEKIAILNAIATAEGTIMEAIAASDTNLHQSSCLVLGFGRCAKILAQKLKGMDAVVTIAARREDALAYAKAYGFHILSFDQMKDFLPNYQYIFNTVPSLVLDRDSLELTRPDVTIIDIASAPGGVDFEYAGQIGRNARLCLGLPGKIAARASADILLEVVKPFIMERSD